ncbi:hypothetical protein Tco_0074646, partial [Tanacetum coccineum]
MVAVGEDEGDAAGAIVVTRWRWMRGGWCGGEDGDVAVVVMWMMVEGGVARLEWPKISPDSGREI